jgi:hypothetical protein
MANRKLSIAHTLIAAVADNATFELAYPSGYAQADFVASQTASTSVMGAQHNDLPVVFDADSINVTWTKDTTLPAGTDLTIGVELVPESEALGVAGIITNIPAEAVVAAMTDNGTESTTTFGDVGGAFNQATLNNLFATANVATKTVNAKLNAVIAALKASGLMVAD